MSFVHLHVHTQYSLLDGACRIKPLVDAAVRLGQNSLAITDHGVMYGAIEFYKECVDRGIKPIIGCEVYVARRTRHDKVKGLDSESDHLVLLCKNMTGYKNLIKMVSLANTEGFYYKPRVDMELLEQHSEGLIALSACLAGAVSRALVCGDYNGAVSIANKYNSVFGKGNYYIELQNHGYADQLRILPLLKRLSDDTGVPLVATNDVHYVDKADSDTHNVLLCINTGKTLDEPNGVAFETEEFYLKSEEEMLKLFTDVPQSISNTQVIANQCQLEFEFGKTILPHFDIGQADHLEYFTKQCFDGLNKRYNNVDHEVIDRLKYEIKVIEQMGFVDYFLIVADFVNFAKRKGIPVGPGRGSGAGSLCAYCMGITDIDPIKYQLLFERFLNPERVTMPDFDIDFCRDRRQEVIDYVTQRYGADHVSQIITFDTLAARASVRDVTRALGLPYADGDAVAKLIPKAVNISLNDALEESAQLREKYNQDPNARKIIDIARRIEGMPRNASKHAAAVVITRDKVSDYVPLAKNDESIVTQYTMSAIENLGLLKMDFLGLRNLTVIDTAQKLIRRHTPEFDITKIPLDDEKTFRLFSSGKTDGVFQFESAGIRRVLIQLKPDRIEDLIAVTSLYRPGPVKSIPQYIENRNSKEIKHLIPQLEPILNVTFGVLVYQEQVMEVFRSLAGYSLGRADIVRRAMAKKKHDVLENERNSFVFGDKDCEGAVKRGISQEDANAVFDEMTSFASYAFNKSHAAAYAHVAFQTAYLKCHYSAEYMAALISSVLDSTDKTVQYVNECKRMNIKILPPDINSSMPDFTVENGAIRVGLLSLKNLGINLIERIVNERTLSGNFEGLYDFCIRMSKSDVNKRAIESLIYAGAFDCCNSNRRRYIESLDAVMTACASNAKRSLSGQIGLFDQSSNEVYNDSDLPTLDDYPLDIRLTYERDSVGFYVSKHPLSAYSAVAKRIKAVSIIDITSDDDDVFQNGHSVTLLAQVTRLRVKTTKTGKQMASVQIEDQTGSIDGIVFTAALVKYRDLLQVAKPIIIYGTISSEDDRASEIIVNSAQSVDLISAETSIKKGLIISVENTHSLSFERVKCILSIFDGDIPVYVLDRSTGKRFKASQKFWVSVNKPMILEIENIVGKGNVKLLQ